MSKKILLGTIMGLLNAGCSLVGKSDVEGPSYKVILKQDNKEIRQYAEFVVAKTTVRGKFKDAQGEGFRILAGYIFGKNESRQKMTMTAPVVQRPESEKISMTAPVVMSPNQDSTWTMTFSMPSAYTLDTLPVPTDKRIQIEKVQGKTVAALTFSGLWNESKNTEKGAELTEWLKSFQEYAPSSPPMFAGYNPPWTLPFFRRNEILIDLTQKNDPRP